MNPSVHSSIIPDSQDMETTSTPIDRGMDKDDVVQEYSEILSVIKNKMPFVATWMHLEIILL